jgi:RimJ/RimL family protein N-acetyltransferase
MDRPEFLTLAPEFAAYRPVGGGPFAGWRDRMLQVLGWAVQHGHQRLLVDFRGLTTLIPPTTYERFQLGERAAAEGAPAGVTIALIGRPPVVDPDHFGVTVAVNRGLRVDVFEEEVSALQWLVGPNAVRPVFETPRTRARWLVPDDAPFIQELVNQPSWLRNIGERNVHDRAGAEGYIANGPVASYAAHGFGLWCVERKEDGAPLGICGLLQRDYLDAPDIGYAFLERHQGQGYASEVTQATMAHARADLGLGRIYASVVASNGASIRVLEKLGMTYLRPLSQPGDSVEVSLYGTAQ